MAIDRPIFPRWLCFLEKDKGFSKLARVDEPETWPCKLKEGQLPKYLFVAYTSEQFSLESDDDMQALDDIADAATRYAGLDAYWLGSSCIDQTDDAEDQVYWISDIVRSAALTCMAIGPSKATSGMEDADMMKEWGSRIWTFPEVLLSRAHQPILEVRRGNLDDDDIERLPLTQFPAKVWNDGGESRRLIDHFNGTLHMNNLELMTTALQCLHKRSTASQHFNGDHSYALMGLVNIRPRPIWADSAFQAFARLSLANNSEKLLERLICVLPRRTDQEWWDMSDAFSVNLWDIYPSVQIAANSVTQEFAAQRRCISPVKNEEISPTMPRAATLITTMTTQ
ncbi:hypothetical protein SLS58_011357 [Diplodia intermedia]|uniref:Heterokaryon incompatibility domain-containing protein n=1 Tax=Diplodia intermedia TaxID=856260 RepID=A0ABR3SZ96_9PEZI